MSSTRASGSRTTSSARWTGPSGCSGSTATTATRASGRTSTTVPPPERGGGYAMHDTVNAWHGPTRLARESSGIAPTSRTSGSCGSSLFARKAEPALDHRLVGGLAARLKFARRDARPGAPRTGCGPAGDAPRARACPAPASEPAESRAHSQRAETRRRSASRPRARRARAGETSSRRSRAARSRPVARDVARRRRAGPPRRPRGSPRRSGSASRRPPCRARAPARPSSGREAKSGSRSGDDDEARAREPRQERGERHPPVDGHLAGQRHRRSRASPARR